MGQSKSLPIIQRLKRQSKKKKKERSVWKKKINSTATPCWLLSAITTLRMRVYSLSTSFFHHHQRHILNEYITTTTGWCCKSYSYFSTKFCWKLLMDENKTFQLYSKVWADASVCEKLHVLFWHFYTKIQEVFIYFLIYCHKNLFPLVDFLLRTCVYYINEIWLIRQSEQCTSMNHEGSDIKCKPFAVALFHSLIQSHILYTLSFH